MRNTKRNAPLSVIQNDNVQQAIKILGAALMLTKTRGLETNFSMIDEFGVRHQFHLDISENMILTPES